LLRQTLTTLKKENNYVEWIYSKAVGWILFNSTEFYLTIEK